MSDISKECTNIKIIHSDLFFDWDSLDKSSINTKQMVIKDEELEKICHPERTNDVLIGLQLR